jgi:arylformamidase
VEDFQGPGVMIDLRDKGPSEAIRDSDFEHYSSLIIPGSIILLCTGWGYKRSWTREWALKSPWLSPQGAEWLVERKIRGVGIDHYSIGGMVEENEQTHRILLASKIWILEDIIIPEILLGNQLWHVIALPLLLVGCSGAPCRVIAIEYGE